MEIKNAGNINIQGRDYQLHLTFKPPYKIEANKDFGKKLFETESQYTLKQQLWLFYHTKLNFTSNFFSLKCKSLYDTVWSKFKSLRW